ncbi:MAG TPA: ABC transporter substrate-binding protein [Gaiellaceae bacterium]|nr:ABC transporter substrate-binding protein [Gaiellaceae bacterium]
MRRLPTGPARWAGGVVALIAVAAGVAVATAGLGAHPGNAATATRAADTKTLVVAVPSDIQNLDPTLSSADTPTQELLTNVYDWLIDYKVVTQNGKRIGAPNQFVGAIAKSFSWNKAHTVLTFHLRKGVKFANGDPLNAAAVKYTYDRIFEQNAVTAALTEMAAVKSKSSVTVVNPTTVQFHLTKANTLLFGNMAQFGHSILDPKVVKAHATKADPYAHNWLSSHVDGTAQGPFVLQSWQPGSQWVMARNPNYYGVKPKLDQVIFKVIPDASSRLALLKSGAVDMAYNLPLKDVKKLESDKDVQIVDNPSRYVVFLGMNSKDKPFDNVKVRQAISYAVPYKTIIQQVLLGYGRQLTSPIPEGTPTHTGKFFHYTTDIAKAKQLLAQAGYPKGFKTTMYVASGVDEGMETAIWVQQSLKQIGINMQIQQLPGANFTSRLQKHDLPFFFFNNWVSINNDPFYHLYWLFDSACCDYTNYSNPTVTKTINANLLSRNGPARTAASLRVQKTIVNDAPWVFLYQPDWIVAMRANVHGYVYYPADDFTRFKWMYKTP